MFVIEAVVVTDKRRRGNQSRPTHKDTKKHTIYLETGIGRKTNPEARRADRDRRREGLPNMAVRAWL